VAALLATAVEDVEPDGVDWFVARLTVELERPVPLAALRLDTVVTRPGRKVSLVEATIARAETSAIVARARALRIRQADVPLPFDDPELGPLLANEPPPAGPGHARPAMTTWSDELAYHADATELLFLHNAERSAGPGVAWIRLCVPVLPDRPPTALQRVAAAVDFANGISNVVPRESHVFINPDLTIHLLRPLRGEWVGVASTTHYGTPGVAMTDTAVFDVDGRIGRSNQSLLLDRS
jgi:hypothetical protein